MPRLVTDDESDDEVDLPTAASPLPGLVAELQLAQEATPPASEVGRSGPFLAAPLGVRASPFLERKPHGATAILTDLGSMNSNTNCSHRGTRWTENSPQMFAYRDTQYGLFQSDATSDNEGRNALCPQSGVQTTVRPVTPGLGRAL